MGWATKGVAVGIALWDDSDDSAWLSLRKGLRSRAREHWEAARLIGSYAQKGLLEMLTLSDDHRAGLPHPGEGDMLKGLHGTLSL